MKTEYQRRLNEVKTYIFTDCIVLGGGGVYDGSCLGFKANLLNVKLFA